MEDLTNKIDNLERFAALLTPDSQNKTCKGKEISSMYK